ncbi:MAG: LptF/LptG family permease [Alphaproteobacteria bacterium]|nr:LptF/LptG family permease [Alphaproteobacteria bacterium]
MSLMRRTIISRFLSRKFLKSLALVLFLVCSVIFSITFVEELARVEVNDALASSLSKLLEWIPLFLPLTVFMAVLLMTYQLIRSSEMIILQSAGLSPLRILRPIALSAMVIGILATAVLNPLSINFNRHIHGIAGRTNMVDGRIWLVENAEDSKTIIRSDRMDINNEAAYFANATVLVQSMDGRELLRVETPVLTLREGGLSATRATLFNKDGVPKETRNWNIPSKVTIRNLEERYLKASEISFWDLPEFIQSLDRMGMNNRPHIVQLLGLVFMPLTLMSMVALGMAFSQTKSRRFHSFGLKISMGVLASFILYFTLNLFANIGSAGLIPAWVAVAMPPLAIAFLSLTFIVSFNRN